MTKVHTYEQANAEATAYAALTDEEISEAIEEEFSRTQEWPDGDVAIARAIERKCAAKWGVAQAANASPQERAVKTQIITGKVQHPGRYDSVNLNGWTLAAEQYPPEHKAVLLGYWAPHIPEVWFGVGYRRDGVYWLGPRGLDPHYTRLKADQVVIWMDFDQPFAFSDRYPGDRSDYLKYQDIIGKQETPNV